MPDLFPIPMTAEEAQQCVAEIKHGLGVLRQKLLELYEREGWKALGYASWRECVIAEFGQQKSHLYRQLEAARIELQISPIGEILGQIPEGQLRPLSQLPAEQQVEAWQEAVETASNGKVTARHVETVVRAYREPHPDTQHGPNRVYRAAVAQTPHAMRSLQDLIASGQRFRTIYADPPWKYSNQATRAATNNHYPTMTPAEIAALPIAQLAAAEAHLHLWTTTAFLFECRAILEAWGFTYKSMFIWVKPQMGIGNYWRVSHECLLLGVKGALPFRVHGHKSWIQADRAAHSQKPEPIRRLIEQVSFPPYLG